jgi:Cu-processing system ATP-binding protein
MIQARGLSKRFGRVQVLDEVDLDITPGRVTAIVGPNAAGKTTFIKSVLGLTRADSGSVLFDGAEVRDDDSYRSRIGYMPQIARFPENLSAAELFEMLKDLRGKHALLDEELIETFALAAELEKPLRTLSGGTRQKVNAAMAFLFSPELLILDEPTAGLDPVSSGVLKAKILSERKQGKTFILTTHIMSEIEELADDVAFLYDGKVRFAGAVRDVKAMTHQASLERAIAVMMMKGWAA